ncbi:MAG: TonB-dependent receptor [Candidatus Sulfotelmatobacter sp.]
MKRKQSHFTLSSILRIAACLIFCAAFTNPSIAQSGRGTITGRATDTTGALLPGARVRVEPGDVAAATNQIGEFTVISLAPGEYKVTISYVGFLPYTADVKVIAGQATRVDAALKVEAKGEQVNVVADELGVAQDINIQRTSDNILDVMSEGVIQSLPNENIADVVGRMPGVSLERDEGEGKYVQIRGTEPRLNNTTVDGVELPAPEDNVRQFKLDTIPSDIVESVEVNKTLAANQDADAIGGTVNLVTKKAGDVPTLKLEGIGGFTPIENTRYIGLALVTVGKRFGRDKRFGALFSGSYDYNGRGIDDIEPSLNDTAVPSYGSIDLREYRYERNRYGFGGSLDYKLKDPASGLYLHYFLSDFKDYGNKWVYTLNDGGAPKFSTSQRAPDYGAASVAIGGKHVFSSSWLSWELSAARSREGGAAGNPGADFQYNGITTIGGNPNNPPLCNYVGAPDVHLPQFSPACTAPGTPFYDPNQWSLEDINTTIGNTSQVNLQGAISYARNYHVGSHFSTFEFGFKVRNAHKGQDAYSPVYDQTLFMTAGNPLAPPAACTGINQSMCTPLMTQYLSGFTNPHYYFGAYPPYGPVTTFSKIAGDISNLEGVMPLDQEQTQFTSDSANFDLTERVSAAYAMNTIEFGRFRLQTGLRIEATQLNILGYVVTQNQSQPNPNLNPTLSAVTTPTPANNWYWDPLPSVQLRYRITDDSDIRAVYGRGISRPNPYDLVPYVTVDQTTNPYTVSVGNPNLKPEHANDYDVLYEHYLKPYGEIQAGFFYKQLSQPIYYLLDPNYQGTQYPQYLGDNFSYIINGVNAKLYGVEFSYIQHLGFLHGPWSGFGIMANYSKTGSSAGTLPLRNDNPALQRQTPTIWNLSPSYDRGRFSARLGATYNSASIYQYQWEQCTQAQNTLGVCEDPAMLGPKGPLGDNYLYAHLQVDAQASYRVGKGFTVLWQGLNLTDMVFGFYDGSPWYVTQREYYRPTYSFGLRWEPHRE